MHSDFDQTREEMTRRLQTAIEHPYVNIIGHPTTRLLGRRPPIDFDVDAVFRLPRVPTPPWKSTPS